MCYFFIVTFYRLEILSEKLFDSHKMMLRNSLVFALLPACWSLPRPGGKQARKHVRDARDFNNIETRAVIKFLPPPPPTTRQGAEGNSRHSDRNISFFPSWSG